MDDQNRNLILATALSFLVILVWFVAGPILFPNAFPTDPPVAGTDTSANAVDTPPAANQPAATAPAQSLTTPETPASTLANSPPKTYKPPYPDRNQLFQSPRVRRSSLAGRGTRDGAQRVQLRGFVNLDGIRAILIVNGETNSMAAGDVSDGIEVISIDPPRVTLQRSRVRWTETLQ